MGQRKTWMAFIAVGFVAGVAASGSLNAAYQAQFRGVAGPEAAEALLQAGLKFAGDGSWERIAIAATYYEGFADKSRGQAMLDQLINSPKVAASDLRRIGRFYAELGEWAKAKPLYDKAVSMRPKDAGILAETGAWYNVNGDRQTAEELFTRSFTAEKDNPWTHAMAAASYLGKKPRPW
jgi:tetratricopeptide (TPR) repeat protein